MRLLSVRGDPSVSVRSISFALQVRVEPSSMRGGSNQEFYVMFRRGKGSRECWQQNSDKAKDISLEDNSD